MRVSTLVPPCCWTPKMWGQPLRPRCYLTYKLRYRTLHKYFRLMAAMFDSPVTSTSESIQKRVILYLMHPKNIDPPWKFGDIAFELRHPNYIWSDGRHFEFLWACIEIFHNLRRQKNVLVIPYRLVKTA